MQAVTSGLSATRRVGIGVSGGMVGYLPGVDRWRKAQHEFISISLDDHLQSNHRVESRYPRLDRLA